MAGQSRPAIPRDVKRTGAMPDTASRPPLPPLPQSFDDPLGRKIIELHVWSVGEGLRGTEAALLFDRLCQRLVIAGVPLWRAFAGMRTLRWGLAVVVYALILGGHGCHRRLALLTLPKPSPETDRKHA